MRFLGIVGSLSLFLSVALGAFGAHALRDQLSDRMREVFETAVRYQLIHSVTILIVAILADRGVFFQYAGWLYIAGIILFSGSLYLLAITNIRALGMITPFGGLAFLAGHLLLLIAFWRVQSST
ncbi:DUF423 domain-containing protein [bacterium]|nr:DUF423 domain-containing protein [bacterium]